MVYKTCGVETQFRAMNNIAEKRDFLRMAIDCQLSYSKKGEQQSLEGTSSTSVARAYYLPLPKNLK